MTARPGDEQAPTGRDDVTAALMRATESLCATGQPSSFTIRQIAAEAGVTTSLLYFYFKSKDDLILATAKSIANDIDDTLVGLDDPLAIASEVSRRLTQRSAFPRLLAWLVLEGRGITELRDDPVLARMMHAYRSGNSPDPETDAAATATLLLGNALLGPAMNAAIGRPQDDRRLLQALDESLDIAESP